MPEGSLQKNLSRRDAMSLGALTLASLCLGGFGGCASSSSSGSAGQSPAGSSAPSVPTASTVSVASHDLTEAERMATSAFASKSLAALARSAEGENLCYSPISAYLCLALVALGAEGETLDEALDALGSTDIDSLAESCRSIIDGLAYSDKSGALSFADAIWSSPEWPFADSYAATAAAALDATAQTAPFSDGTAQREMAQWVEEHTNGLIAPDLSYIDQRAVAALVNAVYFKGRWPGVCFGEKSVSKREFKTRDDTIKVDFISDTFESAYGSLEGCSAASASFVGGSTITFYLPPEGVELSEFLSDEKKVNELFSAELPESGEVAWSIPKFDFSSGKLDLVSVLAGMGVSRAFSPGAELSPMFDQPVPFDLHIEDFVQEARIALDEYGVEAAAYTAAAMSFGVAYESVVFMLDRPFAYAIKSADGTLLFVGKVENPIA